MPSKVQDVTSISQYDEILSTNPKVVFHFWASWAPQCVDMNNVLSELASRFKGNVFFGKIAAEDIAELSERQNISAVPTIIIYKGGVIEHTIHGAKAAELSARVTELANTKVRVLTAEEKKQELNERLQALMSQTPCVVFMKGVPDTPRCKFSKALMQLLHNQNIIFSHFNILEDDEVRQELKEFSDWPTYPQVYVQGELIGGLDIVKEMIENKQFFDLLPKECIKKSLDERLKELINKAPVMLFMKGNPETPKCGFSRNTVQLMNETGAQYETFDILEDNEVRQGLKTYSDWPTFPQLYIKGELIGGLDILKEMFESRELQNILPK